MNTKKTVGVIWWWFGGIATAILLARKWYDVTIYEKNEHVWWRASSFEIDGFRFDMGPSWYLMPDVFEKFFHSVGERVEDRLKLQKLWPSYRIFFSNEHQQLDEIVDIHGNMDKDLATFEKIEPWVSKKFKKYLKLSKFQYEIAMKKFVYKNYDSFWDFIDWDLFIQSFKLKIFSKMSSYVSGFFSSEKMKKIIQYPLLFLGTSPYEAPAIYNIMSHVDFNMGVFYPQGWIFEISKALRAIAIKNGVKIREHTPIKKILTHHHLRQSNIKGVELTDGSVVEHDFVVSNADMPYTEMHLLEKRDQTYPAAYREKRQMAPSGFIIYLGLDKKIPQFVHHNLLFTPDWNKNFGQIFDFPQLPDDPSMYICAPSVSDPSVAPEGKENLFILVPIAPWLHLNEHTERHYADKIYEMIKHICGVDIKPHILVEKIFCIKDFESRYNAYKGTALWLAHTLMQTAIFRPNTISKKVKGLYYVWAYTNPGIGMPMCLISAQLVAERFADQHG